jgi:chemotaxis protein MotB
MRIARLLALLLVPGLLGAVLGCAPITQLNDAKGQNSALMSQSRAQLTEIENLRAHSRRLEQQLIQTEQQMAVLDEEAANERSLRAVFERERALVDQQLGGLAHARPPVSPAVRQQLEDLSRRFPNLRFDPVTGIAKVDTDVMFDSAQTELKPGAAGMLRDLVRALKGAEAADLKVLVVGHTDDRAMGHRPARDQYPTNFHLSTGRALAVADCLRDAGLPEHRLGVAGFAAHQPVSPNASIADRQKNRRVEIFVMAADVPVVGWTDSTPSLY